MYQYMCIFLLINLLQLCSEIKGFSLFLELRVCVFDLMDLGTCTFLLRRSSIVVGHVESLRVFLVILLFSIFFHPINMLHLSKSPPHVISYSHSFHGIFHLIIVQKKQFGLKQRRCIIIRVLGVEAVRAPCAPPMDSAPQGSLSRAECVWND